MGKRPQGSVLTILYRALLAVTCAGVCIAPVLSSAQEDRPEITPLEKKQAKRKKDEGPRALALLRMTANGKATLVPVAIMVDGKFYDASAYKASPVPMALEPGTVYEGERSGSSIGLFTVNGALRSQATNAPVPWLATGIWLAAGAEPPKKALQAEKQPVGIETTDAPPRLTRGSEKPAAEKPEPAPAPAPTTPSTTSAPSSPPPPDSKPNSPAASKQESPKPPEPNSKTASDQSQSGDENSRPRLRRGKPAKPFSPEDEDIPGYSRPDANGTPLPKSASAGTTAAKPSTEPVQFVPAISDADGPDPHSYAFELDKTEADERHQQMVDLARQQLQAYIQQHAKPAATKAAPHASPARTAHRAAPKLPQAEIENVQLRTFDLWVNNQPVLVLTAEAQLPPSANVNSPGLPTRYYITLVARTDIYSNLHKLYAGITDKYHLDVTPQLELIDAVDADGDGRGELLFRETSDMGSGYVIYRATADTLWKMFDSLNLE